MNTTGKRDQNLFFTLRFEKGRGYSLPYCGDLSSLFPGENDLPFLENPRAFYHYLPDEDRVRVGLNLRKTLEAKESFESRFRIFNGSELLLGELVLSLRSDSVGMTLWDGLFRVLSSVRTREENVEEALFERIRELDCLYGIASLSDHGALPLDDLLERALEIMLGSWKYSHLDAIRIAYGDKVISGKTEIRSPGSPAFCQKSDITVYGKVMGSVGVCYSRSDRDVDVLNAARELRMLNYITARLSRIIEKKQSEQALAGSEARFRRYVESAPDGIFRADDKGFFIDVNQAACRITGYEKEELLGMPLSFLTHPDDRESTRESFKRVKSEGRTSNTCRFTRKDGTVRHWVIEAVRMDDGTFLGFNRDVTEQRKLEEQIIQMEKMDAIGQLAGGIAHDFNNQIAVIMGYSEMLVSRLEDPKHLKFAKSILASAHRSDDLTRKLLAFSHKGLYERKSININRTIGEAADILTHSFDRKISIKMDLKAKHPFISGDPSQMQNAIMNLALNARDAMPSGGTLLFATRNISLDKEFCRKLSHRVEPGQFVEITVSDTGTGMDSQTMSRIFEPFFTTKEMGKGTGMGLAGVYGTVTNHRAVIEVESEPGEGTVFRLSFPCGEKVIHEPAKGSRAPVHGNASVMLIDDEDMLREVVREILEHHGYTVFSFSCGRDALDHLKNFGNIDVVILDMIMPVMGGKEVFRNIREIDNSIPVVLSSGYSLSGEIQQLLEEGAQAFLSKPFNLESLTSVISDVIKK
ncbi:MAG: PAS domain S-box protein [Spirochaetales bacterium]|nr:PAS domain S-box protein [Spirochaetales bacterium]